MFLCQIFSFCLLSLLSSSSSSFVSFVSFVSFCLFVYKKYLCGILIQKVNEKAHP